MDCNDICPETCGNTDYKLNVVAYNASRIYNPDDSGGDEGYDYQFVDAPQFADTFDGDSSNFNIDLTLPEFQFNIIYKILNKSKNVQLPILNMGEKKVDPQQKE